MIGTHEPNEVAVYPDSNKILIRGLDRTILRDENRLLQVGLYSFVTELGIEWGPLMAATIGSTIPVVVAFALLQRQFIQGLTGGAVKG